MASPWDGKKFLARTPTLYVCKQKYEPELFIIWIKTFTNIYAMAAANFSEHVLENFYDNDDDWFVKTSVRNTFVSTSH